MEWLAEGDRLYCCLVSVADQLLQRLIWHQSSPEAIPIEHYSQFGYLQGLSY